MHNYDYQSTSYHSVQFKYMNFPLVNWLHFADLAKDAKSDVGFSPSHYFRIEQNDFT